MKLYVKKMCPIFYTQKQPFQKHLSIQILDVY